MRRKPLFPPPQTTTTDPRTHKPVTQRMRNKGRQSRTVLSVVGRVKVVRRWWYAVPAGSVVPVDALIDRGLSPVSVGVRVMACRLNKDS